MGGEEIEKESLEIIEREIDFQGVPFDQQEIIKRVIHATADPEFRYNMVFHSKAIAVALEALERKKTILVDVKMLEAGISKNLISDIEVICYLDKVRASSGTICEEAIRLALSERGQDIGIVAIGNSPTALLVAIDFFKNNKINDKVLIGMPVGFVKALEAKITLSQQNFPFITNLSCKGGSAATAAVLNALFKIMKKKQKEDRR